MADVQAKKVELGSTYKPLPSTIEKSRNQAVSVNATNISGSIIANTVKLNSKRLPRMNYPADSIGADTVKKGYIDYLIKRYFDYRKADSSYGNFRPFNHAEIHTTIERRFKAKTFFIHISRFRELCDYIRDRVDSTILGRNNRSRGIPNFDSYEEYEEEQLGSGK